MPERSTEALLRELAGDLEAVRPVAPLRRVLVVLLAVFALGVAASATLGFPVPGLAAGVPWRSAAFFLLLVGLAGLAFGALAAALAGAVPGRDAAARLGGRVAAAGLLLCGVAAVAWCLQPGAFGSSVPLAASLLCLARAIALAAPPALVACIAMARAFESRPRVGGVWACVGAVSLGAVAVHASCSAGGAAHVLLGHLLEPLLVAAVLGAVLGPLLRRGRSAASAA